MTLRFLLTHNFITISYKITNESKYVYEHDECNE